jgi:broad specificity phosphatase PhoE
MKWPISITLVRHGQSVYNELRSIKQNDELWLRFRKLYEKDFNSPETRRLAEEVKEKFALRVSDSETPLSSQGVRQALLTGLNMKNHLSLPDVIFVSPYLRTKQTLKYMAKSWPELGSVKTIEEDRIREQEHGLSLLSNDWRVFHVLHPEQRALYDLLGMYYYQYPQGESVPQVRERIRSFTSTIIREWSEKRVLLITHHLTILSIRANFERLSSKDFIRLDKKETPKNCGATLFEGNPNAGMNGKLILKYYNRCFWE